MPIAINVYIALGILLSHLLHAHAYSSQGATELATWLVHLSPAFTINMGVSLFLSVCLSMFSLGVGIAVQRKFDHRNIRQWLRQTTILFALIIIASQAISSSVLRVLYESGFVFVFISAIIIEKVFLTPTKEQHTNKEMYERLWDLLRLAIPLVLGFSAIFGGVGAISSFYEAPRAFIHWQMYRHLYLTIYFAIGMTLFVMWPIFRNILTMHCEIYLKTECQEVLESDPKSKPLKHIEK